MRESKESLENYPPRVVLFLLPVAFVIILATTVLAVAFQVPNWLFLLIWVVVVVIPVFTVFFWTWFQRSREDRKMKV